jgi:hypothetical protein
MGEIYELSKVKKLYFSIFQLNENQCSRKSPIAVD